MKTNRMSARKSVHLVFLRTPCLHRLLPGKWWVLAFQNGRILKNPRVEWFTVYSTKNLRFKAADSTPSSPRCKVRFATPPSVLA